MSTPDTNHDLPKSQKKSRDHTLTRVRNNQRRCRERRRQYIATLEAKVEETKRLLDEARAEIVSLKSELTECRSHPHPHHQLAGESGESGENGESSSGSGSIDSAALMMSFGERSGFGQMSENNEEERESPVPLPPPLPLPLPLPILPLPADDLVASTADIAYNNIMSNSLSLQQVGNIPPHQPYSPSSSPALASLCEATACGCRPPDAIIIPQTVFTTTVPAPALATLSTASTPTLTALQLQDLILPTLPASSSSSFNWLYTASPADESTTPCSQAFVFISQQNFKGIDASVIERWLSRGFRQARDPREGCRVENNLLFQLLDFISDP
ncbi:hypothetical protein EMCG_07557 [[Emmonsia] crescens]|uniref:BZIP domain-containing protein n=1 Tax=[Emmonsia] crescens TaxID=73230 RepID=A0A0G2JB22_9EURO|nr:hypothetical protein EMCG_07557 [Emmonsia crescens UAMH 3008]